MTLARLVAMLRASNRLAPDLFESYEERAAIMEFDGGLPRDEAELRAFFLVFRASGSTLEEAETFARRIAEGRAA